MHPLRRPLMGGPLCRVSILRNGNVPHCYFYNFRFKEIIKVTSRFKKLHIMSLNFFLLWLGSMSHVGFTNGYIALSNLRVSSPSSPSA